MIPTHYLTCNVLHFSKETVQGFDFSNEQMYRQFIFLIYSFCVPQFIIFIAPKLDYFIILFSLYYARPVEPNP